MAQNPFSKTNNFVKKPKRNTFDLSFQNNATFNFGTLYPVLCKEVIPGDSYRIDPTFALKFMPMAFPVQTRMNANLHFFYVRNRNLYKDWPDFIAKNKTGLTPPYIQCLQSEEEKFGKMFSTGSLGDYLGLPTTVVGDSYGSGYAVQGYFPSIVTNQINYRYDSDYVPVEGAPTYPKNAVSNRDAAMGLFSSMSVPYSLFGDLSKPGKISSSEVPYYSFDVFRLCVCSYDDYPYKPGVGLRIVLNGYIPAQNAVSGSSPTAEVIEALTNSILFYSIKPVTASSDDRNFSSASAVPLSTLPSYSFEETVSGYRFLLSWDVNFNEVPAVSENQEIAFFYLVRHLGYTATSVWPTYNNIPAVPLGSSPIRSNYGGSPLLYHSSVESDGVSLSYGSMLGYNQYVADGETYRPVVRISSSEQSMFNSELSNSPFVSYSSSTPVIPVSALPFRAYESIYNAFYRDIRNNPYDPNGDGNYEYNKYIPTMEGGADTNTYELHRRNWEQDFLTTAVQSPQQGTAPLVGVTGDGTFRFQDESGQTFTAKAIVSEDGNEITGFSLEDSKMPVGNVQFLMDVASAGFTINDFRSVNSFQRWLETNMRKGLRYRDQIMAHYGVSVRYDELDMPEFIGGMSVPVTVNQVTQTTPTDASPLGMYAGQASAIGKGRSITKYFDEHGFIMAIFSVTPVPNYSQLLPKYFLKTDALDYFFPEFGHIGYQPIFYNEVCPLQGYNAGGAAELQKVFGYQRAWYEYLASTDEVHGEFRTTLRNYLINRVFSKAPELSEEFLLVDPEQVNDVFAVTTEDTGDKILGQIYFKISAKRPIPLFGIPKIE